MGREAEAHKREGEEMEGKEINQESSGWERNIVNNK